MEKKKVVIALGGNALGKDVEEQKEAVAKTAKVIVDLAQQGLDIIVTHGNGPQVGMIQNAMDNLVVMHENYKQVPLPTSVAMSQGYIGIDLQNAIKYELYSRNIDGKVSTIPIVGLILIIMTIVFVYITTSTKYGKKVYAVGSNMKGAQMAGINTAVVKISVFVIAGALVGIGAFLWIAMNASADPATTGNSYEMYAIAAAVLGGISMSGGKGKCLGILFGAMSYTIIDKIIVSLKMDSLINNAIKGIILLIVIMVQIVGPQIKQKFKKTE